MGASGRALSRGFLVAGVFGLYFRNVLSLLRGHFEVDIASGVRVRRGDAGKSTRRDRFGDEKVDLI